MTVAALLLLALASQSPAARVAPAQQHISYDGDADGDIVRSVPGFEGPLPSVHRAGYVGLQEEGVPGKQLFWYLAESERDVGEDPLVLWLNGGPGCSSFDGFVYEHGPFTFDLEGEAGFTLKRNPFSFSRVASMLYLDSPAGVGLSYSDKEGSEDYFTDDDVTAADAETFLRKWFAAHPSFQQKDFYISGESYAGVYVPNLAKAVVQGNAAGRQPFINLKGYLVGNGCTDPEIDGNALPPFAAGKSLISQLQLEDLNSACKSFAWNASAGSQCDKDLALVLNEVADLNIYDVLEDCFIEPSGSGSGRDALHAPPPVARMKQVLASHGRRWPALGSTPKQGVVHNWGHLGLTPPCTDARVAGRWLNNPHVRQAIHAAPVGKIGRWALCSDKILYQRTTGSLIPTHLQLTQRDGLRALIYSGDHDMAVPHTGSEAWTSGLGLPVKSPWAPWYLGPQVAGYKVEYEGLTYLTIKGAGHMVPMNKPAQALEMFEAFLKQGRGQPPAAL